MASHVLPASHQNQAEERSTRIDLLAASKSQQDPATAHDAESRRLTQQLPSPQRVLKDYVAQVQISTQVKDLERRSNLQNPTWSNARLIAYERINVKRQRTCFTLFTIHDCQATKQSTIDVNGRFPRDCKYVLRRDIVADKFKKKGKICHKFPSSKTQDFSTILQRKQSRAYLGSQVMIKR